MAETTVKNLKMKKILNIAFYVVLFIVFVYAIFGLFSKKDGNSISFLGITSLSVQSGSMEPVFSEGDLIFVRTDINPKDLNPGDIITYQDYIASDEGIVYYYNTHKIVSIDKTNPVWRFETKGEANAESDPRMVVESEIYGQWTGKAWSGFGTFVDGFTTFLKSSIGFFLFIVVPCLALLVYEVIKFMKVYAEYNVQKHTQDRVKMQEEAIAAARAQLEAEAESKKAEEDKDQQ
ncbi:MAG: signal peptidase I [Candidatus Izemoplasmatales bacterium]